MKKIRVQDEEVEEVDEFVYLGAKVSKDWRRGRRYKEQVKKSQGRLPRPNKGLEHEKYRKEI